MTVLGKLHKPGKPVLVTLDFAERHNLVQRLQPAQVSPIDWRTVVFAVTFVLATTAPLLAVLWAVSH